MAVEEKDITKLTGSQKVAIILLSMSEEKATKLFSLMNEEEITEISHAMSHLGPVASDVINKVMDQLIGALSGANAFLGNLYTTEKLLGKILDKDRVQTLMDDLRGPQGRNTWEKLTNVNEELLALYFRNEHPQTAALILSKISPDHAAKVLSNLPEDFAFEIIARILNLGSVKKEVLERVEKILRAEFISSVGKSPKDDSFQMLAEIFNNLDRNSETKFMGMLEAQLPDAATRIKEMMFTFEDIVKIDSKGIQRLLRDIEKSRLTLALKGTSDELRKVLFASMSKRAVDLMLEDLQALGSVRVKDVDSARAEIIAVAKDLIEKGEIEIALDNKDEFIN